MSEQPDWQRLQKALAIEAERGFSNLKGNQYYFHEFLRLSFSLIPELLVERDRASWQKFEEAFAEYPQLSFFQRQHLVNSAQQFLEESRTAWERRQNLRVVRDPVPQTPRTRELVSESHLGSIQPQDPLKSIKSIGLRNSKLLERLELFTVRDLLFYYPRDHADFAKQVAIRELEAGETVTLVGTVRSVNCFTSAKNKKLTILEVTIADRSGKIRLSRFFAGTRFSNRGWQEMQKKAYPVGAIVAASGLVKKNKYGLTLDNPEIEVLDREESSIESIKIGRMVPVYPLTEGVSADVVRKSVVGVLSAAKELVDPLPQGLRDRYDLIGLCEAIQNIHFPEDRDILRDAKRRLIFDEFFYLQLGFLQRRYNHKKAQTAIQLAPKGKLINQFYDVLPFQLTNAQQRVVEEILNDLQSSTPMNRLVQGDVGSGKTVVAVIAILAAIQANYQAALMAPTEVLAEQHYRKLVGWFNLLHIPVELLTGSTKTAKRREIYSQIHTGELPVLVGTHALIQDTVSFHQLGLVVIDEQHRFGVGQRARLQQKGDAPHVLTMTATPIPRTLALTMHGDLDVSQIDELPPGRQTIQTTALTGKERHQAYELIRREIAQGRQAYIVLPLIEESEKLDVRSAVEEHKRLSESVFPEFTVGLLHGRMSSARSRSGARSAPWCTAGRRRAPARRSRPRPARRAAPSARRGAAARRRSAPRTGRGPARPAAT
ncbi:MAG: ATP-dependent DNA helicase RecG, partial [Desertifilum sp. SIO1I2]|nr:ATP-dependent DNA helicase RecG [Desertifilum sp. SIO1I2]